MYGGIDQLIDTYKGNPQPLAQKVQRDQQSQPPGRIPPDLEEALALQKITELRNSAQSQQAMQAGGAQPSVVEKLRQMLGGMQQQAQMAQAPQQPPQGQPVMAARGGSIDQLMSNLGRHYAGGGIVAFNGEDESKVKDPNEDKRSLLEKFFYSNTTPAEQRRMAALQAIAAAKEAPTQQEPLTPQQMEANVKAATQEPVKPKENMGTFLEKFFYSNITPAEQRRREALQAAAETRRSAPVDGFPQQSNRAALNAADATLRSQPGTANAPAPALTPAPSAPRPSGINTAPAAAALDPESLRGLTEAYLKGEFKLSPEAERDKTVDFTKKTLGLDALLAEKERRANEREALIKRAQGERMPDWVEALSAAGRPVRGGLGSLLGQMGNQAQATREAYANQDLKYQAELAQLRDVITNAKIDGNKELVKQGMAAYKEVNDRRTAAATNATSLVRTDEMTEQRKDEAKARLAALAGRGAGAGDKQQLNELKALQTSKTNQLKTAYGSDKKRLQNELAIIEAEIAKMAGISTMAAAPGAGSPGGTKPGWGKASVEK
jgi:hypothetical protein